MLTDGRFRYENPMYFAEDAGAADLIAGGRLQLGISRGSPEQVIDGWRYFGYQPAEGKTDADMARTHAEVLLMVLKGEGFAQPSPRPMFHNPPGLLRVEPHSPGLRDRIWWGAGSDSTAVWAAQLGMNLQSSTLKNNESDDPFHVQQARQIQAYRDAWKEAGHEREPRVSVSRSIFALSTSVTGRISAAATRATTRSASSTPTLRRSSAAPTPLSPTSSSSSSRKTRPSPPPTPSCSRFPTS